MWEETKEKTYALFSNASNRKLIAKLEEKGSEVLPITPLEIIEVNSQANRALLKKNLSEFDWIIFPDILAVDYFIKILEENKIDVFELDEKRVLAMGEAIADQLRFVQLHADIIPKTIDAETVFSTLSGYLENNEFAGLSFLIPKEESLNLELKGKLLDENAKVTEIIVYRLESKQKNEIGKLKALLKGGAIDEVIFTSPTDVVFLKHILTPENLSEILSGIKISGVDEVTIYTLRENNIQPRYFKSER